MYLRAGLTALGLSAAIIGLVLATRRRTSSDRTLGPFANTGRETSATEWARYPSIGLSTVDSAIFLAQTKELAASEASRRALAALPVPAVSTTTQVVRNADGLGKTTLWRDLTRSVVTSDELKDGTTVELISRVTHIPTIGRGTVPWVRVRSNTGQIGWLETQHLTQQRPTTPAPPLPQGGRAGSRIGR